MVIQDQRLAFMEADRRLLALNGTGATQSERNVAGAERIRTRNAWITYLREPVTGFRLVLREGVVVSEYAEHGVKASYPTSLNLSQPATKRDIGMIAEEVWEMARPYPILELPDAECVEAWKSAKRDALPKIEAAITQLLDELRR